MGADMTMSENDKQDEPVAWVRRHPDGALTNEFLEHEVIEPFRKNSGAWVPLYTHPAPAVAAQNPNCGACPGDGSVCEESCRVAYESPAVAQELPRNLMRPINNREKAVLAPIHPSHFGIPKKHWEAVNNYTAVYFEQNNRTAPAVAVNEQAVWDSALELSALTIQLFNEATLTRDDYMLDASECAGIILALKSMRSVATEAEKAKGDV